jgi:hypothetical protein
MTTAPVSIIHYSLFIIRYSLFIVHYTLIDDKRPDRTAACPTMLLCFAPAMWGA